MTISITNERIEKLARQVARESGESLSETIIHALEDRIKRMQKNHSTKKLEQDIMRISKRCSALPDLDSRSADEILGYTSDGVSLYGH